MLNFWGDLRHGVRLLRRTPGFTAAAILVLALGIGANTAVFSLVNTLLLQPRPGRIDQLVAVFSRDRTQLDQYRDFSYPEYVDLREQSNVFDRVMAHTFSTIGITEGGTTKQSLAAIVSANYFDTLGVRLAAGRPFTIDEERPGANAHVVVASHGLWRRRGLDPAFIGSTVRANGTDYTVVGVAPRGFSGTMSFLSPEWWFPLGSFDIVVNEAFRQQSTGLADRANYALNVAGALNGALTQEAANQALDAFGSRLGSAYPATDRDHTFLVDGLARMNMSTRPTGDGPIASISALLLLMSALVLAVACLNLANLLLARGVARRREMAIRQALGGSRRRVVEQLLAEGLVLSTAGATLGLLLGWWTTSALAAWLTSYLPFGLQVVVEPSPRMIVAATGLALFSTLCFALGPAWSLSRPALVGDLKREAGATARFRRGFGTGSLLVTGQLAMSLALVAAGGLFVRAAVRAADMDPGFILDHQLIATLDPSLAGVDAQRTSAIYHDVMERVRSIPGVESASLASSVPFGEFRSGRTVRRGATERGVSADFIVVGSDYFRTLGMSVVRGREFTRAEEAAGAHTPSVVIDRLLSERLFGQSDPMGEPIVMQVREGAPIETRTVVGVVSEMRHDIFDLEPRPHVFLPTGSMARTGLTVHVRTAPNVPDESMLGTLRRELLLVDASLPILSMKTMAAHRYDSATEWIVRAAATVFSAFGGLALLLATIGVYGLKSYDVSRRTREIGIRIALGATGRDIQQLMLREGFRTTLVGLTIGVIVAAGIGKLVSGLLYQVSPFDPVVLLVAAGTLTLAALAACYVPARRASRVTPLVALRSE